jgi:hypothetical protein
MDNTQRRGAAQRRNGGQAYGVPIRDAIRRGNLEEMRRWRDKAEEILEQQADLPKALEELNEAIRRLEGKK